MRKAITTLWVLLGLLLGSTSLVLAQSEEYRLNVHRNIGYSSGSQIRGSFSIDIVGPANIQAVTYQHRWAGHGSGNIQPIQLLLPDDPIFDRLARSQR